MPRRAVRYYCVEPPPEREWEQDFATMARSGFEAVVLPVAWDGPRDSAKLLPQARLAARHGLRALATPRLDACRERPGAPEMRSWAKALRETAPELGVLLVSRAGDAPPACDADAVDWGIEADGSLHYPDEFVGRFTGDTAVVNGAAWPYLEVVLGCRPSGPHGRAGAAPGVEQPGSAWRVAGL